MPMRHPKRRWTRSNSAASAPPKQRRISAAALKYLNETGSDREVFFDVVSVTISGDESTVNYFPQAWIPMYL